VGVGWRKKTYGAVVVPREKIAAMPAWQSYLTVVCPTDLSDGPKEVDGGVCSGIQDAGYE
jgi:hypothetical protein